MGCASVRECPSSVERTAGVAEFGDGCSGSGTAEAHEIVAALLVRDGR
jgi:hypothetical protein